MKLFFLLLFSLSFSLGLLAEAPPVILEKGKERYVIGLNLDILEDKKGHLGIEEVNDSKWSKKFKRGQSSSPNLGISKSTFWARFKVKNLDPSKKWILSYNFVSQDHIEFFQKKKNGWKRSLGGDRVDFSHREFKMRGIHFEINPGEETLYFIKSKGFSTQMSLTISSSKSFAKENVEQNLAFGLFFGLALMMLIHNFFNYLRLRELSYLLYVYHVGFYILFAGILYGFGHLVTTQYLPWLNNEGHLLFSCLAPLFLNLFASDFLHLREKNPILYKVSLFWSFALVLSAVSSFFVPLFYLRRIYNLIYVLFVICLMITVFIKMREKFIPAKYFSAAILAKITGTIILVMTFNGFIESNFLTRHATIIGSLLEMILLSFGLSAVQELRHLIYLRGEAEKQKIIIKSEFEKDLIKREEKERRETIASKMSKFAQDSIRQIVEKKTENLESELKDKRKEIDDKDIFHAKFGQELQSPLNSILGFSQVLLDKGSSLSDDELKKYPKFILSSGRTLLKLIQSEMVATKNDMSGMKLNKEVINFHELCEEVSSLYHYEAQTKNLEFEFDMDKDKVPKKIISDGAKIRQALGNFLNNAINVTQEGMVKFKVSANENSDKPHHYDLKFQIEDMGSGIGPIDEKKIFEPLLSVEDMKSSEMLSGLRVGRSIFESINGEVVILSQKGKGAVFSISIKEVVGLTDKEGRLEERDLHQLQFESANILIGEGRKIDRELIKAYLKDFPFTLHMVENGRDLLKMAKKIRPDLIISNLNLELVDSSIVARNLKVIDETKNIPMLAIGVEEVSQKEKFTWDGFLKLPLSREILLLEMANFLPHKKVKLKDEVDYISYVEFSINFSELRNDDIHFLKDIQTNLKKIINLGAISFAEEYSQIMIKRIKDEGRPYLLDWFKALHQNAVNFNNENIVLQIEEALMKLEEILPKS